MSNAAAKKRRAPASIEPPSPVNRQATPQVPGQNMSNPGLTLPQVIALIDKRLVNLEIFVADSKKNGLAQHVSAQHVSAQQVSTQHASSVFTVSEQSPVQHDDFNTRFDALADEIANMKNIVLSLQSYTMDVNKVLMEERVRILSEVSNETTSYNLEESSNSEALEKIKNMISEDSS